MGPVVQRASIAAWNDEAHVEANRALYRAKFAQVMPLLAPVLDVALPDAAFYLWAGIPAGPDGLIVEVHPRPNEALSDGDQSLTLPEFSCLLMDVGKIATAMGRSEGSG